MTTTRTNEQRLTRFGIWVGCIALAIYPPIGWAAGLVMPFVDIGLRLAGIDIFPLTLVLTYAILACTLRFVVELGLRGYIGR